MTSGDKMVKYGGGGFLVFFEPLTKGSWGLSYIFLITLQPSIFVTIDDPTLLLHRIFILGGHQEVFDGGTSFEIYLYTIGAAFLLDTFTQSPIIWNSYIGFWGVVLLSGSVRLFLGWVVHSDLNPIQCPSGVIAVSQSFGQVFFLLQLLVVGAYGFCSVVQSSNNTIFGR